jgi:septum formation protein
VAISIQLPLLLGSASPRRKDILEGLGIPLLVRPSDAPEDQLPGDSAEVFIERVVQAKLRATREQNQQVQCAGLLVADTIVVVDGAILGKPLDRDDAYQLLRRIAGREHQVITRYGIEAPGVPAHFCSVTTDVRLRPASLAELRAYADSGEGLDKAGAYAAQGLGAFLIERISGSYSNVVGLPAMEVVRDLLKLGLLREFPLSMPALT